MNCNRFNNVKICAKRYFWQKMFFMKGYINSIVLLLFIILSAQSVAFGQKKKAKDKDYRKENFEQTGRPGEHYRYKSPNTVYNPQTGKYELMESEWKKQPDEYTYDPKKFRKAKHKSRIYGGNPLKRLFKIKPRGAKPGDGKEDKEQEKDKPFTTGEEKKSE